MLNLTYQIEEIRIWITIDRNIFPVDETFMELSRNHHKKENRVYTGFARSFYMAMTYMAMKVMNDIEKICFWLFMSKIYLTSPPNR